MTIVGFIPGPSWERATAEDDRPTRWCFNCRKHLRHTWALMDDPPERHPSYYEPITVLRCERCKHDHTDFPGMDRDGPHYPSRAVWDALVANLQPLPFAQTEGPCAPESITESDDD